MTPSDRKAAFEECQKLLKQGLIEPTNSDWACQAFYMEKRSEKIRGKMRLVIDYRPLNLFLKDDKFPLPKIYTLYSYITNAFIFLKFDMKSSFWQLGLDPKDRPKTAFCIPNAHFQWTVLPFGLKVAPSLFQKAITQIFEPILTSSLIYIDDILLFSPDEKSHKELLEKFYQLCHQYGLMLSSSKSQIGTTKIEFLGMKFSRGKYSPQPHLVEELPKFPEKNFTTKQIQQFLGILNYIRDFTPNISHHTSKLSKMLKKNAPPWRPEQTEAVRSLKEIAKNPPPLKIPGEGKRILQIDASDHYWGAVLIEEIEGQKFYCGHASGQFKPAEAHYHTTYKETLAVKYGIQKFDFHFRGHVFEIHLDNSSFPKMLELKNKIPPSPQILRLKEWFSRYDFTVRHIKGNKNVIPDFLSRPKEISRKPQQNQLRENTLPIPIFTDTHEYSLIMMNEPTNRGFSSQHLYDFPLELLKIQPITPSTIKSFVETHMFHYLATTIQEHQIKPKPTWFNPVAPYLNIFPFLMDEVFTESDM